MNSEYAWTPQKGPQLHAIMADFIRVILYGGARGGGKSDYLLGDYYQDVYTYGRYWQGILFRSSYTELEELILRGQEIFRDAQWLQGKHTFRWKNGAQLKMRYIETIRDVGKYQGHQYPWMGFDEITNQKDKQVFRNLIACNRSAKCYIPNKRIRLSGNPGGPGHAWVKELFVDPCKDGYKRIEYDDFDAMFIPSKVADNRLLMENDPDYIKLLQGVGSPELVRAWLEGDWDVVLGAYFPEYNEAIHVCEPFAIPSWWQKWRAMDWGLKDYHCCLWAAMSDGSVSGIEEGAIVVYREQYDNNMTADQVAPLIKSLTPKDERIDFTVMDPSAYGKRSQVIEGPTIAEVFERAGVRLQLADNSRLHGWMQIRQRLRNNQLKIFKTCHNLRRTIPLLQHDKKHLEDAAEGGEDHAPDTLRYLCMARPYVKREPVKAKPIKGFSHYNYNDLHKAIEAQHNE